MTLQTQHPTPEHSPAVLTDEQRRRVADALENAQSENTRRNYAGQFRKFRDWCEREEQSPLPTSPEVVVAYAAELVDVGKSMSTVRLAVAAIVDAHKRLGQESPVNAGVAETLRGLTRQFGANQKQAKPLDADALAAIRATAFTPRESRGGSMGTEDTAPKCGRMDIALASVLSDTGLRVSEAAQLRLRDVLDAEDGAGLCVHRALQDRPGGRRSLCGDHSGDAGGAQAAAPGLGQVPGRGVRVRHPDCTAQAAADCVSGASCSASCFVVTPGVR